MRNIHVYIAGAQFLYDVRLLQALCKATSCDRLRVHVTKKVLAVFRQKPRLHGSVLLGSLISTDSYKDLSDLPVLLEMRAIAHLTQCSHMYRERLLPESMDRDVFLQEKILFS